MYNNLSGICYRQDKGYEFRLEDSGENTFDALLFYGALGGMLAMYFVNHKTRKPKFYCLVPLFLAIQIILGCIVYM